MNKSKSRYSSQLSRRQFLLRSGIGSIALASCSIVPASVLGANAKVAPSNRITMGLVGIGAMGRGHLHRLVGDPGIQLLAVCDVDRERCLEAQTRADAAYASERTSGTYKGCQACNDYRDILGRPDIDAVLMATPDHWHTPMSIEAAKAGKDVYCEKPITICVEEGRRLVETIRRTGRVFQTGTQYRSIPVIRQVCNFVRSGGLGQVKSVFTLWSSVAGVLGGPSIKPYASKLDASLDAPVHVTLPAEPVPAGLDWDLWVGPAPWHDYSRAYHINPSPGVVPWCFDEDFGTASVTWHHSHSADVVQYALGMEKIGPVELIHPSSRQFPTLTCKYANGTLLHMVEHWGQVKSLYHAVPENARLAGNFGGLFVGERGWITSMSTGGPIEGGPPEIFRNLHINTREVAIGTNDHHANWFRCIRTRGQPSCDEELGHRSASLGHLIIIAYRLGRNLKWDPGCEEFLNDDAANRLRSRTLRQSWRL